jgi:tetratricopeptide (TPR) repeat protein
VYQGDHAIARQYLEKALDLAHILGDHVVESQVLSNLCLLYVREEEPQKAVSLGRRGLAFAEESGLAGDHITALTYLAHALVGAGSLDEAEDLYRHALSLPGEFGQKGVILDARAGLAQILLLRNQMDQALAAAEVILNELKPEQITQADIARGTLYKALDGTENAFQVYWTCYQVLQAAQDQRFADVLRAANVWLQQRAAQFVDQNKRRLFLESVPSHRALRSAWQMLFADGVGE